jgi:hypothetical protein
LDKPYGIKPGAIGNALRNNLGTWGISREHDENILGTRKKNKKNLPHPTPKGEKQGPS